MNHQTQKAIIISGENMLEKEVELEKIKKRSAEAGFEIENIDGENLELNEFIDLISGVSLFSPKRLIVTRKLSQNNIIWANLAELCLRISEGTILVNVEDKLDRRTKNFKEIAKVFSMIETKNLTEKDSGIFAKNVRKRAEKNGCSMGLDEANYLVFWVGLDEWRVFSALDRLILAGDLSRSAIEKYIPQNIAENTFVIFENALKGRTDEIMLSISNLKNMNNNDGGYQFFGLISSQFFNLCALKIGLDSSKNIDEIARSLGANAWALRKMEEYARSLSHSSMKKLVKSFSETDSRIKKTSGEPWDFIEALLLEISIKQR